MERISRNATSHIKPWSRNERWTNTKVVINGWALSRFRLEHNRELQDDLIKLLLVMANHSNLIMGGAHLTLKTIGQPFLILKKPQAEQICAPIIKWVTIIFMPE